MIINKTPKRPIDQAIVTSPLLTRINLSNQTIVTSSLLTRTYLSNLPVYRKGLKEGERGFEIGLTHGFFLIGPFLKLGPLRDSVFSLLISYLCTVGLLLIMFLGLVTYINNSRIRGIKNEKAKKFVEGIFTGLFGGSLFSLMMVAVTLNL
tara:strand:- start:10437 stop:10886 length:450 start_codon:yes stop_codon:yes gene_type:complete